MRVASLFSGIGGFEFAFLKYGHDLSCSCEILPSAKSVLMNHFRPKYHYDDIRSIKFFDEQVSLLTAGFPCQDLSQAGKRQGLDGDRSSLISEVFRILKNNDIDHIIIENVKFMLYLNNGSAIKYITEQLSILGYKWAYRVINSIAFTPQRRERVYLFASKTLLPENILLSDEAVIKIENSSSNGFYWTEGKTGLGWAVNSIPPLKGGSSLGIPSPPAILLPSGDLILPDIIDAERFQGFPPNWTNIGNLSDGQRWHLIGNAITVDVADWIASRIDNNGNYNKSRDFRFDTSTRWPRSARFDGKTIYGVNINDIPLWKDRPALHEFLIKSGRPLSLRAAKGFLSRATRSKLHFPNDLLKKVENYINKINSPI